MEDKLKIIITDDHSMLREGLKQLLEFDGDIEVVGQAGNAAECLSLIEKISFDVLLLDINLPGEDGLKILQQIKASSNNKVLMLTIHNEVEYLIRAMQNGADGYILKDRDSVTLKKAIYSVFSGETYIDPSLIPAYNERMRQDSFTDHSSEEDLTRREIEVLKLVAEGFFNKEIAAKLDISEKTVKNHISSIFKKIDVADRTQAAIYAIKNRIFEID